MTLMKVLLRGVTHSSMPQAKDVAENTFLVALDLPNLSLYRSALRFSSRS